eukprot:TRINITY_DN1273_c0_g1_i1.p1 TRINITY_DN1273_c0_g1~~TRINITY_DN1273_c0_g1_i1.p1  ORF type:complete len:374 (+),score=73.22 TRINITY_DN1273_c0_g1_i1:812-1933(+)
MATTMETARPHVSVPERTQEETDNLSPLFKSELNLWPKSSSLNSASSAPSGLLRRNRSDQAPQSSSLMSTSPQASDEVQTLTRQLQICKATITRLLETNETQTKQIAEIVASKKKGEEGKLALKCHVAALEASLKEREKKVVDLEQELDLEKRKVAIMTKQQEVTNDDLRRRGTDNSELANKVADLLREKDALNGHMAVLQQRLDYMAQNRPELQIDQDASSPSAARSPSTTNGVKGSPQEGKALSPIGERGNPSSKNFLGVFGLTSTRDCASLNSKVREYEEKLEEKESELADLKAELAISNEKLIKMGRELAFNVRAVQEGKKLLETKSLERDFLLSQIEELERGTAGPGAMMEGFFPFCARAKECRPTDY